MLPEALRRTTIQSAGFVPNPAQLPKEALLRRSSALQYSRTKRSFVLQSYALHPNPSTKEKDEGILEELRSAARRSLASIPPFDEPKARRTLSEALRSKAERFAASQQH